MATTGCEILFHVVLYMARSWYISQEKVVDLELPCFVRLPLLFLECYLKLVLCFWDVRKPKYYPNRALPWTSQTPGYFWHYAHVSCSYNFGAFSVTNVVFFFSVLTPAQWGKTDPAGHQLKNFSVSGRISNLCQISSLWESVILPNL